MGITRIGPVGASLCMKAYSGNVHRLIRYLSLKEIALEAEQEVPSKILKTN
jgi:hypothetical protein